MVYNYSDSGNKFCPFSTNNYHSSKSDTRHLIGWSQVIPDPVRIHNVHGILASEILQSFEHQKDTDFVESKVYAI